MPDKRVALRLSGGVRGENPEAAGRHRAWTAERCDRAPDDRRCELHFEREFFSELRNAERAERTRHAREEYCAAHKGEKECIARALREEREHRNRVRRELLAYCRRNPDAPRCEPLLGKWGAK